MRVFFYDVADKLALGNARRCDSLDELLDDGRDGHPARRRPAGQRRPVRRRAVRQDAAAQPVPQPVPRHRRRPRRAPRRTCSAGTSPAPPSTCSRGAQGGRATRSCPACTACRTSSSPRTSAAPPRRRSRTSAGSWPASSRDFADQRQHVDVGQPAAGGRPSRRPAGTGCCTCTTTCPACWPRSTGCWPTPGQHRGPDAVHPRRARLRDHRRRR